MYIGARGKLRRFLGDPEGPIDLQRAGDRYLEVFAANPDLLTAANLYRLAGSGKAYPVLRRLQSALRDRVAEEGPDSGRTGVLVDVCFLLGEDEACAQAWAELSAADPRGVRGLRHEAVARLAEARAAQDVEACDEVVAVFDKGVTKEPDSFYGTGGMNYHDWLEIALVTRAEVSGEPSPRLFEL